MLPQEGQCNLPHGLRPRCISSCNVITIQFHADIQITALGLMVVTFRSVILQHRNPKEIITNAWLFQQHCHGIHKSWFFEWNASDVWWDFKWGVCVCVVVHQENRSQWRQTTSTLQQTAQIYLSCWKIAEKCLDYNWLLIPLPECSEFLLNIHFQDVNMSLIHRSFYRRMIITEEVRHVSDLAVDNSLAQLTIHTISQQQN